MKDELLDKAIAWAQKRGFETIKANREEFETPRSFSQPGSETIITPDITGVKMGTKSFIEIALKEDDKQSVISRWKLFGTLAARKGGKLYLLTARGHKAFTENIVKNYHLTNAMIISI